MTLSFDIHISGLDAQHKNDFYNPCDITVIHLFGSTRNVCEACVLNPRLNKYFIAEDGYNFFRLLFQKSELRKIGWHLLLFLWFSKHGSI